MLCEINFQNMNTYLCYQLKEIHDSSKKTFHLFYRLGYSITLPLIPYRQRHDLHSRKEYYFDLSFILYNSTKMV